MAMCPREPRLPPAPLTCAFVGHQVHLAVGALAELADEVVVFVDVGAREGADGQGLHVFGDERHPAARQLARRLLLYRSGAHGCAARQRCVTASTPGAWPCPVPQPVLPAQSVAAEPSTPGTCDATAPQLIAPTHLLASTSAFPSVSTNFWPPKTPPTQSPRAPGTPSSQCHPFLSLNPGLRPAAPGPHQTQLSSCSAPLCSQTTLRAPKAQIQSPILTNTTGTQPNHPAAGSPRAHEHQAPQGWLQEGDGAFCFVAD